MEKQKIIALLDDIGYLLELEGDFEALGTAFHKGARVLKSLAESVDISTGSEPTKAFSRLPEEVRKTIYEIEETGTSRRYEEELTKVPRELLEVIRVFGLRAKLVQSLWKGLDIIDFSSLKRAMKAGHLSMVKGIGIRTEDKIARIFEEYDKQKAKDSKTISTEKDKPILAEEFQAEQELEQQELLNVSDVVEEPEIIEKPEVVEEPEIVEELEAVEELEIVEKTKVVEELEVVEEPKTVEEPEVVKELEIVEEPVIEELEIIEKTEVAEELEIAEESEVIELEVPEKSEVIEPQVAEEPQVVDSGSDVSTCSTDEDDRHILHFPELLTCSQCGQEGLYSGAKRMACYSCGKSFGAVDGVWDFGRKKFYSDVFHEYSRLVRPFVDKFLGSGSRDRVAFTLQLLELSHNSVVLDVGCKNGVFTNQFAHFVKADENGLVVGVDTSLPLLKEAARCDNNLLSESYWVRSQPESMPFKGRTFNRIHCGLGIEYARNIDEMLREFYRVLDTNGIMVISTLLTSRLSVSRWLERNLYRLSGYHLFLPPEMFIKHLESVGFVVLEEHFDKASLILKVQKTLQDN